MLRNDATKYLIQELLNLFLVLLGLEHKPNLNEIKICSIHWEHKHNSYVEKEGWYLKYNT